MVTNRESLDCLNDTIIRCEKCPRLRKYCQKIAREKRRAYLEQEYWGRPVPGFGDARASIWIIGLAPAAHGGNRTGRIFTGDRSGEWLFRALFKAGFANQPTSVSRDDGLKLNRVYVSSIVRCAPPDNKPLPIEIKRCNPYLIQELNVLGPTLRVVITLGRVAFATIWPLLSAGEEMSKRPDFLHGQTISTSRLLVIQSFHPSQQNTFTGKLTEPMFDSIFQKARNAIEK